MKTKIVCPNKNDPAWKTLVDAIGEPRAYLTFFRNHNVIPDVTTARAILGLKEERDLKVAATPATLAASGVPQSGMNYAVKSYRTKFQGRRHSIPPIPRIRSGRLAKFRQSAANLIVPCLLKKACDNGSATRPRQATQSVLSSLSETPSSLVHLFRFPRITINHGIVLYGLTESDQTMEFDAYDPNIPEHPVKLVYERKRRVFTFAPSRYWGGGVLSVMEIYCDWPY